MTADRNRTALVIDDDPDIVALLQVLLESRGFAVEVLSDGIQAVDVTRNYDVILLDLKMPVFDGERLADYWGLTRPELLARVVVLSGFSKWARVRSLPVYAVVPKPFDYNDLLDIVEKCATQGSGDGLLSGIHTPA
jgi:DNA-binding response OmpR family regulator